MSPQEFSDDSVLGHIKLDLYADKDTGEINIFHEGEFEDPVIECHYYPQSHDLFFVFSDQTRMYLGAKVSDDLHPHFAKQKQAALYQITDEGEMGQATQIPLKQMYF